jgi:flagellar biosynthesis/type III secretory pathway M-ring protein FliF/YscJ
VPHPIATTNEPRKKTHRPTALSNSAPQASKQRIAQTFNAMILNEAAWVGVIVAVLLLLLVVHRYSMGRRASRAKETPGKEQVVRDQPESTPRTPESS